MIVVRYVGALPLPLISPRCTLYTFHLEDLKLFTKPLYGNLTSPYRIFFSNAMLISTVSRNLFCCSLLSNDLYLLSFSKTTATHLILGCVFVLGPHFCDSFHSVMMMMSKSLQLSGIRWFQWGIGWQHVCKWNFISFFFTIISVTVVARKQHFYFSYQVLINRM